MGWIRKGVAIGGAASAAALAWRALRRGETATRLEAAVAVQLPRAEVWSFWRKPEELPHIVPGLEAVKAVVDGRYRWWTSEPVEIDGSLEILDERPEEVLSYRVEGSGVEGRAQVRLSEAAGGGTVVRVTLDIDPPGAVGRVLGAIDPVPRRAIKEVLRRHRQLLEAGEIPTTDGQPAGAGRSQAR
ncbi:MAG TPA: SRPBCC family protein [Gemmatimonadota bacterium]|nr:SRPBCC family protein [Gemmatimonadota bacterium]